MKQKLRVFLTLLLCAVASVGWGQTTVTDELTYSLIGVSSTTYSSWSGITSNSSAVYAGQSAGGNNSIQLRSKNSNSGIVTTTSGGKVKSVTITFNANTSSSGQLDVYGKNTAYTSAEDLYKVADEGTKLGSAKISEGNSTTISITDDYEFIGFRSYNGAVYIDKIEIVWETGGSVNPALETTTTINVPTDFNTDVYTNTTAGQLTATVKAGETALSDAVVSWESSNEGVATIDENGNVTLVAVGSTTITASYAGVANEYKASQDTYEITVTSSAPYTQPTTVEANLNNSLFGTNYTGTASGITDESPVTGIKDNVTIVYAGSGNHYINDSQIRFYPSNKLTFTAPEGYKISSIVFTSGGTWAATISANEGTYTASSKTWTGNASSVVFTGSGSSRCDMSKATITLASADAVPAPVISGTTPFLGSTEVTITAEEGASIYYTTNGDTPTADSTPYSAPFSLEASATVKAIAVKGDKTSEVAEMAFVKTDSYKLNETSGLADGDYYLQFDNAVVTYVKGAYNYLEDVNGAILYYKSNSGLKAGDVINGYKLATVKTYSGQFEATSISDLNATAGEAPQPTVITIADLLANTASNMSKYVKLEDVAASADGEGFILSQNGSTISFYGRNGAAIEDGKSYDIIGFLSQHNSDFQFMVHEQDDISEIGVEYSEAPVITVSDGTEGAKVVTITAAEGANIYYTTDGTTPSEESNIYTEPLTFTEVGNYTISAIAIEEGKQASTVVTSEFEIVAPPAPAIIDLSAGQSISTIEFPSFNGNGYQTLSSYEIVMSDGNAYSWSVSDAMKSDDNLQLKASTGSLTSPEIRTPYGYVVTATYTCGSNVAEMTLTSGEASATGTIVDEELGTHEVSLNVESLAAGFTLSTGNRFAYLQSITITALIAFDEKANNASDFAVVYDANVGENKNVKMLREFGSGYWNTLVVPFDLTRAQLEEAFGEGVQVAKYTDFNKPANIKFATVDGDVTRADLMIVKPAATVTNPIFKGVTLEEGKAYNYPSYEKNYSDTNFAINGRFAKQVLTDSDDFKVYFLNKQGLFTHPTSSGNVIRGFRWFIQLKTPESSTGAKIALDVDGDVTSIDAIDNGQFATDAIYNLSGQRVNKAQKGIYIVNGKKVVVK